MKPEEELQSICVHKKLTLSLAESCTGGEIAARITKIPGASHYFVGGIVAYTIPVKEELLNVPTDIIRTNTVVSLPVAESMARGVLNALKTNLSIAVTGIAGPTGATQAAPVGTVCMAIADNNKGVKTYRFQFQGDRRSIIDQASTKGLQLLLDYVKVHS